MLITIQKRMSKAVMMYIHTCRGDPSVPPVEVGRDPGGAVVAVREAVVDVVGDKGGAVVAVLVPESSVDVVGKLAYSAQVLIFTK